MSKQNWATNINFHDGETFHPRSLEELSNIVAQSSKVKVRGTGHCFNPIADSYETVVVLDQMPKLLKISSDKKSASVSAGMNYAEISEQLHDLGFALHNLASLPHISVGGAIATGTHGSGIRNGALHTAVKSILLMQPDGSVRKLSRGVDLEFEAAVVGLGLTGISVKIELDIEPTYEIMQTVYGDIPRAVAGERLVELLSNGYNTNFFTEWDLKGVGDVWFKSKSTPPSHYLGAEARSIKVHPILSEDPDACSEQLGIPGPWFNRLPHFRIDANPSAGNELQSEFFVSAIDAPAAFGAIEKVAPEFGAKLLVSEIRAIAGDNHWMSPAYNRDSVAFHFTWKNDYEVPYLISLIEDALQPFTFRPHPGKLFNVGSDYLEKAFPKLNDFKEYVISVDPSRKFSNKFTDDLLNF